MGEGEETEKGRKIGMGKDRGNKENEKTPKDNGKGERKPGEKAAKPQSESKGSQSEDGMGEQKSAFSTGGAIPE